MIHSNIVTGGVHCSPIVMTATDATRNLNAEFCSIIPECQWKCSSNDDYNKHSPKYTVHDLNKDFFLRSLKKLMIRSVGNDDFDDSLFLSVVNEKKRSLPSQPYITSNHVLINNTRVMYNILPLIREKELDKVASNHAKWMATQRRCKHSNMQHTLSEILQSTPCRRIGENVCSGKSVKDIHNKILNMPRYKADRNNMGDRRFSSFGVGVATSSKGRVYICQIYKG